MDPTADPASSTPAPENDSGPSFEALVGAEGAACAVKLPIFEGPLDLLLHLIRLDEVEITEIPVARIAEQYLEYLDLMRELNIDVAGEYLLMAATLAWIKSRMLLPPAETEDGAEEALDPRAELIARLLEYKRFKEVAEELGVRRRLGRDVFRARTTSVEGPSEEAVGIEVDLFDLLRALQEVLRRAKQPAHHELDVEKITVRERMQRLMDTLASVESIEFFRIFSTGGESLTRPLIVATFLGMLELARQGLLRIYQGKSDIGAPEGPIRLRRAADPGDALWKELLAELA